MNNTLLAVHHTQLAAVWPKVVEVLRPAIERFDGYTSEDVYNMIANRRFQLWIVADPNDAVVGVVVTALVTYPQKRTCLIHYLAGEDFEQWRHLERQLERWALQQGCKDIELRGRKGWLRRAREYEHTEVICRKKLEAL